MFIQANAKTFFYLSCILILYFGFLFLNTYVTHFTFVLIGVFQELLTFPLLLLQVFLVCITFTNWRKEQFKFKGYSFWSFLMLIITSLVMILVTVF